MQGAERDAPILHGRRCERRLMRRTSRAEACERICRGPRWCGSTTTRRLARRISIERESFFCRWCRVAWTTLTAAATQPTVPASGGFSLVP